MSHNLIKTSIILGKKNHYPFRVVIRQEEGKFITCIQQGYSYTFIHQSFVEETSFPYKDAESLEDVKLAYYKALEHYFRICKELTSKHTKSNLLRFRAA